MNLKPPYSEVIEDLNILTILAHFEPTIIGTPPLGIDIASSDIDIACTSSDLQEFVTQVTANYSHLPSFISEYFYVREHPAARCAFMFNHWEIEFFCQNIAVNQQWGVRHFKIEKAILLLMPEFKSQVIDLKQSGLNTEAAFAQLLGLKGDPFETVLALEKLSLTELKTLLSQA